MAGILNIPGSEIVTDFTASLGILFNVIFWAALVVGVIVVYYLNVYRWPKRVTLFKHFGKHSFTIKSDKARTITGKDGTRKIVLFRTRNGKDRLSAPMPDSMFRTMKGNKDHYFFYVDDNLMLQPARMDVNMQSSNLKVWDEDRIWWMAKETKRRFEKYKQTSNLEKYLPAGLVMMSLVITMFIAYFGFQYLGDGMTSLAGQFGQVASSCTVLGP